MSEALPLGSGCGVEVQMCYDVFTCSSVMLVNIWHRASGPNVNGLLTDPGI